ncbi:MAG: Virulence protein RhuM family [Pseudomonadota bacterium]|jgi:hypothetical protein
MCLTPLLIYQSSDGSVKSAIATRFRVWATQNLRGYIVKGFFLDNECLSPFL